MGHIFKRKFSKKTRKVATANSAGSIAVKALIRKLDKQHATKKQK